MCRAPGFPSCAYTRDLPRHEIIERKLSMQWWAEFVRALLAYSAIAGCWIEVPVGFLTNGASIPRIIWIFLSPTDPDILYASYVHDLLYALQGRIPGRILSKLQCDQIIRELMIAIGAPKWKANVVFTALLLFGYPAWIRNDDIKLKNL